MLQGMRNKRGNEARRFGSVRTVCLVVRALLFVVFCCVVGWLFWLRSLWFGFSRVVR